MISSNSKQTNKILIVNLLLCNYLFGYIGNGYVTQFVPNC